MKVFLTTPCVLACVAWIIIAEPSLIRAAVVTGEVGSALSSVTTIDLTSAGTLDWAYWNSSNTTSASGTAANRKSGAMLIGDMFAVGGGSLRGSTSTTKPLTQFSFTDGTAPMSTTTGQVSGLFNTQLDTNGAGVGFSVTLPTVQTYTVYVWAAVFNLTSTNFTASLTGATSYSSPGNALTYIGASGGSAKDTYLVSLTVTPDNPGDTLSVVFTSAQFTTSQSAHTLITGVAVSPAAVPEPAEAGLLAGLAGLAVVVMRRRRLGRPRFRA